MTTITLDSTLRDLYDLDGGTGAQVVLAYATPLADIALSKGLPAPEQFAYQSPLLPSQDRDYLAREFLHLLPQLFAFVAGKMPVVLFDLDEPPEEEGAAKTRRQYRDDARSVYERLAADQRPELSFVTRPADIPFAEGTKFAIINPMDCFAVLPQLCSATGHYELLSKTCLALSDLTTPPSKVVIAQPTITEDGRVTWPDKDAEMARFLAAIETHPLPVVLKLPQSLAGQGTFLIRTAAEREAAIRVLRPEIERMLSKVTPANARFHPASLVLQEMVPGEAVALSLFVTAQGRAVFNACCHQLIDGEGKWGGNYIDYREQDALRARYTDIMDRLARHTRARGYWGPFGADVMTDAKGRQLVIDMNVRVVGSHPLGALRTFFQSRGLHVAICFFPVVVRATKVEFEAAFGDELAAGRLVIGGWVHLRDGKTSMMTVTLAAEDRKRLEPLIARVNQWKVEAVVGSD